MKAGTEGYESHIDMFVKVSQALDFQIVCKDFRGFLPHRKGRVLDLGSGAGQNAAALDELGMNVTAIEPIFKLVEMAQETYSTASVKWLNGGLPDLNCLSMSCEKFDFVLIEGVWHHLNEVERSLAITRLSKIINTKGKCAISLRNGPAGLGSRVFVTDTEVTIRQFEDHNFECIFKVENQDSILPNKQEVKWSRIVLEKQ